MVRKIFVIILFTAGKFISYGQIISIGSLQEAILLAFEKNPEYQNYTLKEKEAQLEYKQSKSYRFPTIVGNFSGQKNYELATTPVPAEIFGGPSGQTINAQFGQEYVYNAGFTIRKDLLNSEFILKSKLSKLNTELVQVEIEKYEEFLKQSVCLYYYTALIAKKAIEVAQNDLLNAVQISDLIKEKYNQGLLDQIVYNQSKINENIVKQNLSSNIQLQEECVFALKKLLGVSSDEVIVLAEDLDYSLPKVLSDEELEVDLSIKNAHLLLDQADIRVKLSQSFMLPTFSINAYTGQQQFRQDFGLGFEGDNWSGYRYLMLNLSIPIFTGLNNSRNITKSKINHLIVQNDKKRNELTVRLEDKMLITSYQSSLLDADFAKDNFKLYSENQRLTYDKYLEGFISLDNYLSVCEDYMKAENAYLNSLSKVYNLYSQIFPRILL